MGPTEVIIVAAGQGHRMQKQMPKVFLPLAGRPLLAYSLEVFARLKEISGVILVVPAGEEERAQTLCRQLQLEKQLRVIVPGGARRQDSVRIGLDHISPTTEIILVHDAARPFVTPGLVQRVMAAAAEFGAAVPGIPVVDTLKRIDEVNRVMETIERRQMVIVQTPQGFRKNIFQQAYQHAWEKKLSATDDAALVESLGKTVKVIEGEPNNFKITTAKDLLLAEAWLK